MNLIHKAMPVPGAELAPHCAVCGQRITLVPGGSGPVWVHADSGAVAAPNPGGTLTPREAARRLARRLSISTSTGPPAYSQPELNKLAGGYMFTTSYNGHPLTVLVVPEPEEEEEEG